MPHPLLKEQINLKIIVRVAWATIGLAWIKSPLRLQLRGLGLWIFVQLAPEMKFKEDLQHRLNKSQLDRLNKYCKLKEAISLPANAQSACQLSLKKYSHYVSDLLKVLTPRFMHQNFLKEFGDVTWVPNSPTFVKSRPIGDHNQNSVLLPLNVRRHFVFPQDPYDFHLKVSQIIWRGASLQEPRKHFLSYASGLQCCDVGDPSLALSHMHYKKRMSLFEQMRYKYLVSLEGNDVASNLKWIMNSNSLCLMPKPRFETWFLESELQAGVHYVELKEDYSNLQLVFDYYEQHPAEALQIIHRAQAYTRQFKDAVGERLLAQCVAENYFHWTR